MVAFIVNYLKLNISADGKKASGEVKFIPLPYFLSRWPLLPLMTSLQGSGRRNPPCWRKIWSRSRLSGPGVLASLIWRLVQFVVSFILLLAPPLAELPELFRQNIIDLLQDQAPVRRTKLTIPDKDSCKFRCGYVALVSHRLSRTIVWELYRLDCSQLFSVLLDHPVGTRISGD